MDTLFGLPAHPLVVHAAVVLLPIAAVTSVLVAAIPKARRRYGPLVLGVALAGTIAVVVAQQSGESLEDRGADTSLVREHTEKGETVLPWAIALTLVAGAVVLVQPARRQFRRLAARAVTAVLLAAAVVAATGATWTVVVNVGHSGAEVDHG